MVALGVLVVLGAAAFVLNRAPASHLDGAGPLGSILDPGIESEAVYPRDGVTSWTYGTRLCVLDPAHPATIVAIQPAASVGSGYTTLGIHVRTFTLTEGHTEIIGVEGYPPPSDQVPDALIDPTGSVVTTACANGLGEPYTELLVGLGQTGRDGGGWHGIDVTYTADGSTRTLHLDHDLYICGPSVASACPESQPSSG